MRYQGTLVEWNDARGFGFVQADAGGEKLFVHISAFKPKPLPDARPSVGMHLEFAVGHESGKKRALQVTWKNVARSARMAPAASRTQPDDAASKGWASYGVIALFVMVVAVVDSMWGVQRWVASMYGVLSVVTLFAYWKDKRAARLGHWRTPESTLHSLALLGGWPGAIIGQQRLRHKSSKSGFRSVFWLTVLLNVAGFVWLHSPWGHDWLPILNVA